VEEARRVLARLERIEALDQHRALPSVLLTELRALLDEAEDWVRAERNAPESALQAVEDCRQMLESTSRTLLA
jgi:Tfp pilus assembly protein PilN